MVFPAKQPLGSQETPAAIREGFAVQHLAGTGAQLLLVVILWHMLMTPQPTVPVQTLCHLRYQRKKTADAVILQKPRLTAELTRGHD